MNVEIKIIYVILAQFVILVNFSGFRLLVYSEKVLFVSDFDKLHNGFMLAVLVQNFCSLMGIKTSAFAVFLFIIFGLRFFKIYIIFQGYQMCQYIGGRKWIGEACRFWVGKGYFL